MWTSPDEEYDDDRLRRSETMFDRRRVYVTSQPNQRPPPLDEMTAHDASRWKDQTNPIMTSSRTMTSYACPAHSRTSAPL